MGFLLMSPGPTMLPDEVLKAGAEPMTNHRVREFSLVLRESMDMLKPVFGTTANVFLLAGSGRTAIESALVNALCPGDKVLVGVNGNFGNMLSAIAQGMGFAVVPVGSDWTRPLDVDEVQRAFASDSDLRALAVVHSETSTSILNDIASLAQICRRYDKLLIVDAVSSLGGVPVDMDRHGIDIVASGSQKCLMAPPGIGVVAVREEAWPHILASKSPRYTYDFRRMKEVADKPLPQTPGTTPVSLVRSLHKALSMIHEYGIDSTYRHTEKVASATRAGVEALGLSWLPGRQHATSPTVTTVSVAGNVDVKALTEKLYDDYGIHVGRGLGKVAGDTFRIGHMGIAQRQSILDTMAILGSCMKKHFALSVPETAAYDAAKEVLDS